MGHVNFTIDGDIGILTMSWPGAVNLMDASFVPSFTEALDELESQRASLSGVILRSDKKTFFAGADLNQFSDAPETPAAELHDRITRTKAVLRRIETLGLPVVAVVEGAAMGGGCELALACHHRVMVDDKAVRMALPEVQLGLLPGAGGVVRMVRRLGVQAALPYLIEGKPIKPAEAESLGLAELARDGQDAMTRAKNWIKAHPDATAPWDVKGYKIPGGLPYTNAAMMQMQVAAPAMLTKKTRGTLPAPEAILAAAVETAKVDLDTAFEIETRYLVNLLRSPIARAMSRTLFIDLNALKSGDGRPDDSPKRTVTKLGVLGAGMMGAGIAYAAAVVGVDVVLLDTDQARADKGKAYSEKILSKAVSRGRKTAEQKDAILARITATTDYAALQGADLMIEAVFEDPDVKEDVTKKAEPYLAPEGIFASNTSTIPISDLARASAHPDRFIGLHFFSPVDKMQLVEIIRGRETSDRTTSHAIDFVTQIAKIPIVVNDARGFFTSRVFGAFVNEGAAMLGEGVPAAAIENAALQAGMPVGPLAVLDEVTLTLPLHVEASARKAGVDGPRHPGMEVLEKMVAAGRTGRAGGKGFYDYPEGGEKTLFPQSASILGAPADPGLDPRDIRDRLLYAQAVDAMRVKADGTLTAGRELNIGSIFGIGFPVWTGGIHSFVEMIGAQAFQKRADELAEKYGPQFRLPDKWTV